MLYDYMFLVPRDEYRSMTAGKAEATTTAAGAGDKEEKQQVNNIDVSHGGTILIQTKGEEDVAAGLSELNESTKPALATLTKLRSTKSRTGTPAAAAVRARSDGGGVVSSGLAASSLVAQERQLMRDLIQERLQQLNGRPGRHSRIKTISAGGDGHGTEREMVHQIQQVGRTEEPPVDPRPPKRRRKTGPTATATVAPTSQPTPMDTTPTPLQQQTTTTIPMDEDPVVTPSPARVVLPGREPGSGIVRPRRLRTKTKKKTPRNDPYAPPRPLPGKHPRSWKETLPAKKRMRTKFPYLDYHIGGIKRAFVNVGGRGEEERGTSLKQQRRGTAGMSRVGKRGLTKEDWESAEEDAADILPPSKRKPEYM